MTRCERCHARYDEFSDGWDGLCPSCADVVSEYMDEHNVDRDQAIHDLTGELK
jgi:hypothetical protein